MGVFLNKYKTLKTYYLGWEGEALPGCFSCAGYLFVIPIVILQQGPWDICNGWIAGCVAGPLKSTKRSSIQKTPSGQRPSAAAIRYRETV